MRLRRSALTGNLDAAVDDTETTLSSPDFAVLPEIVGGTDIMALILDPGEVDGDLEIVWVEAHAASDTEVTVIRGKETDTGGGAARAHADGTSWVHGPTPGDFGVDLTLASHDSASDPLILGPVVSYAVSADIQAVTPRSDLSVAVVTLFQAGGGEWTSNTGISVIWAAGAPPVLSTTPGNVDILRFTALYNDGTQWLGEVVAADVTP